MPTKKQKLSTIAADQRLLEAATCVFARLGYDGASTRMLADAAGVNVSAIQYYFGNKEGLYHAVVEALAVLMLAGFGEPAKQLSGILHKSSSTDAECRTALHYFLQHTLRFMLSDQVSPDAVRIFLREQAVPSAAFEQFYKVMQPVLNVLNQMISRLTGLDAKSETVKICTLSLIGQAVVFKTHHELALRELGWKKIGDKQIDMVLPVLTHQLDSIIAGYQSHFAKKKS